MKAVVQQLISHWREQGIPIRPGVSAERLRLFESAQGIWLPPDAYEYFSIVDGLGPPEELDDDFFSFSSLEFLMPCTDLARPSQMTGWPTFDTYYAFGSHAFGAPYYCMSLNKAQVQLPIRSLYLMDYESRELAPSLESFFSLYLNKDEGPTCLW